ncbi:MAG: hypothetical protein K5771_08880 [Oscillospiraceae bacterium]|nr:hypothetical protein [Oscillospiraceae bacterium]
MVNESIKNGTRLCYKKNENGYAWVTVTEHKEGNLTYIREGKSVTVPDSVIDSRLFTTLQEARDKGLILDQEYEDSARTNTVGELKKLEYLLGEEGIRSGHALDRGLIKSISNYVDEHLTFIAKVKRFGYAGNEQIFADRAETEAERRSPRGRVSRQRRDRLKEQEQDYVTKKEGPFPYISEKFDFGPGRSAATPSPFEELEEDGELPFEVPSEKHRKASVELSVPTDELKARIAKLDKSFGETLLDLIEEKQLKNSEFYNRANISKQLFYRITTQFDNPPKKNIALACAIALRLDLEETKALLEKAGYALSHSRLTDVIVEAFIAAKHYDIFDINEYLYESDADLLGSDMR